MTNAPRTPERFRAFDNHHRLLRMGAPAVLLAWLLIHVASAAPIDLNTNGLADAWELTFNAAGLTPNGDADGDGVSNRDEARAGTNPFDAASSPSLRIRPVAQPELQLDWPSISGKRYHLQATENLSTGAWWTVTSFNGANDLIHLFADTTNGSARFFRVSIEDMDTDGDQVSDWEELALGFDPKRANTERYDQTDFLRFSAGLTNATNIVIAKALDSDMSERWPDPGLVSIRRRGGSLKPITVNFILSGTATLGSDYTATQTNSVFFPPGVREVWVEFQPIADSANFEPTETIILTLQSGTGYTLGTNTVATCTLANETSTSPPSAKAAARFLLQAAFGPDADASNDADIIPENVEEVMTLGFNGWIDQQFARPAGLHRPYLDWLTANSNNVYWDRKAVSWWNRVMGVSSLYPGGPPQQPDPLRQRVAFCLSQIFVISDRNDELSNNPHGMTHYYDMLVTNAFGNFRNLLYDVATHPCMGFYLSHLKNQKANPAQNIYPDENFAREIMQLFSIGLWELNPDGTRKLDPLGNPIPTYGNDQITEFARVFTGFSFGGTNANQFQWPPVNYTNRMKMWDSYHDLNPKTLLNGVTLPARTATTNGTAGLADVNAAVDCLFNHTNVAPFIGRQLIQRLVTSNPSTGYVARVAAAFNNNGSGVRGDLRAVIKAILLDVEARDPQYSESDFAGKLREPYLRAVNLARAFNASAPNGIYELNYLDELLQQEPYRAPSVFNFFLPTYSPPGKVSDAGLVAPEFQVMNSSSAMLAQNYFYRASRYDLSRWGASSNSAVTLNVSQELMLVNDVDALIRRVDFALTGAKLSGGQWQTIREAIERFPTWTWERDREIVRTAIHFIVTSPEFCILR